MSVELTTMAMDTFLVKPQKGQGNSHQAINNFADTELSVENKIIAPRETLESEQVDQISKKEPQDEENAMPRPQLEQVAKQLQEFMGKMNRGLEFLVDEDSGRDVIKVLDKTSGELIKQYPSEEVLSLVAKLSEATGNLVNTKV